MVTAMRLLAFAIVVGLATVPPSEAPAAVVLRGTQAPSVQSDGLRYVAYSPRADVIRVRDTRLRKAFDVVARGCFPSAVRFNLVLVSCIRDGARRPYLLSVRTRRLTQVKGALDGAIYEFLGRYWLGGYYCDGRACGGAYLNRRTGEHRGSGAQGPRRDPDTPDLRPIDPEVEDTVTFQRARSLVLFQREVDSALELRRLDRDGAVQGRRVLSRCAKACSWPQLGGGLVTWTEGRRAYVFDIRRVRRSSWRFPRLDGAGGLALKARHTRQALFVEVYEGGKPAKWALHSIRLP